MDLPLLLEMSAEVAPDRAILGCLGEDLSCRDVLVGARRAAATFATRDIRHVAMLDENSPAVPLALFGAGLAGLTFAPLNYRLDDLQLRELLQRLRPALVIAGEDQLHRATGVAGVQVMSRGEFLAEARGGVDVAARPAIDPDDVAVLLFTSGTTGTPKAALLRHRHLASYILSTVECVGADLGDAQLVSVPPYHIAGLSSVLSSVYAGRRLVYLPTFEPDGWINAAARESITHAMVVPTMLARILERLRQRGDSLPALRHLAYGGGRMPLDVIEDAMRQLPHVDFVNAYGLTETSSTIAVLGPTEHREAFASSDPEVRKRLTSVGRPLPTIELEIRGPGGGPLPAGEHGEVYVRGDQVAGEYLGSSGQDDGWFGTRDGGHLDAEGFLHLEGRLDDVIVRGAENLSPAEIEDCLCEHPMVVDAAAVGVPDDEWGEAVAVAVVTEPGARIDADEIREWVRSRLRSAKTPGIVEFRSELPYSETGKLLRRVLRSELGELARSEAGVSAR